MWDQAIVAILSMMGVALGAALQHHFGRTLESRKQVALQRSQAYADYFRSVALIAQHGGTPDHLAMAADAKVRVCLYGSSAVIKHLKEFEDAGAVVATREGSAAIVALLADMRKDTGIESGHIDPQVLRAIVLKSG
jgi:hypothetical protein